METMIGVDLGTTSTKTVLFDVQGHVLATANIDYPLYQDEPEMAEEDPETIFEAVIAGLSQVLRQQPENAAAVQGVAFSAAMHSVILLDEQYHPLTRVITWADNRAAAAAAQLQQLPGAQALVQRTGVPIHPMSPLAKLMWLQAERPELVAQMRYVVGIKDYVLWRLCGELVQDYSLANATGWFNLHTMDWDSEALQLAGLTPAQLPRLVDTSYILPRMDPAFATVTGLSAETPLIIGASDGTLSNLGVNAIAPGVLAVTIGTSGAVRAVVDHPVVDPNGKLFTYYLAPNRWVVGGPVNNGGIVFRWVRDQLFAPEKLTAEQLQIDPYTLLTEIAANVPAGAEGLLFHPYLGGERAPIWNADARGSFFGLTRRHTRAHMVRATLEGIVYNLYAVMLMIQGVAGEPVAIQATGGFAQSALWRQMLADIFEREVTIPASFESSALGAAVIGMQALGMIDSLDAVAEMVGATNVHQPNVQTFDAYRALLPIWIRLAREVAGEYAAIAAYQRDHH
ncbi:gluconokinase [Lacticaseibacillus baoqingensis]|uniref:Gluconokinase n=1 Tax=Lacticaseibacillus baoqingensis TaxID=2486013 RepID=A0ABW4E9M0_9LACO|nr:gluconokinase [Lacticaseibacillus baoqingensis]